MESELLRHIGLHPFAEPRSDDPVDGKGLASSFCEEYTITPVVPATGKRRCLIFGAWQSGRSDSSKGPVFGSEGQIQSGAPDAI